MKSATRLLLLISWPYARRRRFRTVLTVASIVLGVALYVGMQLGSQSVQQSFGQMIDRIAGMTQLQITAGENGFPEDVLERVQDVPEVSAASAVIETVVESELPGQGSLLILGVDMMSDQKLRSYQLEDETSLDDPLVLLAQPDSVIVSRQLADRDRLKLRSTLDVLSAVGPIRLQVRGIMQPTGLASAYGGSIAVMDIYSAQHVFGRGRTFDRIDVVVQPGTPVEACRRKLQDLLGSGFRVEAPSSRRETLDGVTRTLANTIAATSLLALLVAVFIIYNTFSIAVTERRKEIGILRALGAPRSAIIRLVLLEGAIAGAIGVAVGLPAGRLLAAGVTHFLGYLVGQIFGYRLAAERPVLTLTDGLIAAALGLVASLLGAFLPALHAARQDPVVVLRKGHEHAVTPGQNRMRLWLAAAVAVGIVTGMLEGHSKAFYPTVVLILAATLGALLTPAAVALLIRLLRPVLKAVWPVEGALAADSLLTALRRTASTVGALMLSLAMAVGFAGLSLGGRESITEWLNDLMTFDLFVTTDPSLTTHTFHLPADLPDGVAKLPGVAEVQPVHMGRVPFRDSLVMLISVDIAGMARRSRFKLLEGNLAQMIHQASEGHGLILSESLAATRNLHLGNMVELGTPSGPLKLPVVGVYVDFTDQQGNIVIDRSLYVRCWQDDSADVLRVYLKTGADQMRVRQEILDRFAGHGRMFVLTSGDVKQQVTNILNQWYAMSYVQIAMAVLVAMIGIVNSLTVSVIDRRRELGILRALGGLRSQIRRAIWIEAGAIGLIGAILGLVMGAVLLWFTLELNRSDAFGYGYNYIYPAGFALLLVPLILASAWAASISPAESAVHRSPANALEYE